MAILTKHERSERLRGAIAYAIKSDKPFSPSFAVNSYKHLFSRFDNDVFAINPWAADRWSRLLAKAVLTADLPDSIWAITMVSNDWEMTLKNADPINFQGIVRKIRRRVGLVLRPHPFLLQIDVSFRRYTDEFDTVLSPHVHGLMWAPRFVMRELAGRLGVNHHGVKRFHFQKVADLAGWLAYASKDTATVDSVWGRKRAHEDDKPRPGKTKHVALLRKHRVLLFQLLGDMRKYDLAISSGPCKAILSQARYAAIARATPIARPKPRLQKLGSTPRFATPKCP